MTAYYNENDPYAAQWLRNLIAAGHIAPGVVDERDMREIESFELAEFTQCHFFAGIGIWSAALRKAGWPDDAPIWTGSCPCQPFSAAGKQKGFDDDRHLWPHWFNLIAQRRPPIVIGEQVASALAWFDLVSSDMEGAGYAIGAGDLCAAGFDGAHIRQRLYFVGLADDDDARRQGRGRMPERAGECAPGSISVVVGLAESDGGNSCEERKQRSGQHGQQQEDSCTIGLADNECNGQHRSESFGQGGRGKPANSSSRDTDAARSDAPMLGRTPVDWLYCRDGKWRPVEAGTFPLVDADTGRVGKLRAYGNALDLETASEFCAAVREIAGV